MLREKARIDAEAIGWVIRLREASSTDWEAFTLWLEADPEHLAAYEEVADADADVASLGPSPEPAAVVPAWQPSTVVRRPARFERRAILGWGVAASLALVAGWSFIPKDSDLSVVQTAAAENRTLEMKDGSRIILNGGTKILVDEDRPRFARLEQGEALFEVVHDAKRPFEVEVGDMVLRDMGTVFNVIREPEHIEVAVSEGEVLFNPDGEATSLKPGMTLRKAKGAASRVDSTDRATIGTWKEGRLIYSAAPISKIAADLSRNLGVPVVAQGAAGSQPFSGIILLEGTPAEVLERSASLLGMNLSRSGAGWTLTMRTSAAR
jgi:transmembrane sensor